MYVRRESEVTTTGTPPIALTSRINRRIFAANVVSASVARAASFDAKTAAVRATGTKVRVDLVGDSTQTDNAGDGRGFCANLTAAVDCVNMSKGGASTRTYREQGLWERALATRPDYMLIQFGHNDIETKEHLDRQVSMAAYEANLRRYLEESSNARRSFANRAAVRLAIDTPPPTSESFSKQGSLLHI